MPNNYLRQHVHHLLQHAREIEHHVSNPSYGGYGQSLSQNTYPAYTGYSGYAGSYGGSYPQGSSLHNQTGYSAGSYTYYGSDQHYQPTGQVQSITAQTHGVHQNVVPQSYQPTGQVQSITAQTHGVHQDVVPQSYQPTGQVQS
ncbi:hypothetical protein, partial [Paenibacillus assamensis]|uniref:hypothetical protein n=1 Tax=Paenibacillus assamensis TaxID=311244 RepID=UPI00048D46ED